MDYLFNDKKKTIILFVLSTLSILLIVIFLINIRTNIHKKDNQSKNTNETLESDFKSSDLSTYSITYGPLHIEGSHILDKDNNIVQLRGISTHNLSNYPYYINDKCFKQLKKEFSINVIRLAIYPNGKSGYCTDGDKESIKRIIDSGIQYATDNDLYVIINWHITNDTYLNSNQLETQAFFSEMSEKYAQYDNVLYEISNEDDLDTSWSDIKSYSKTIIETIRQFDDNCIIIVGTPCGSTDFSQVESDPINDYSNIMYSFHFSCSDQGDTLRNSLESVYDKNLPVFCSEVKLSNDSIDDELNQKQANQWFTLLNQNQISYALWDLSNRDEPCSFLNASCTKINDFESNDLSVGGTWFYDMIHGKINIADSKSDETTSTQTDATTIKESEEETTADIPEESVNDSEPPSVNETSKITEHEFLESAPQTSIPSINHSEEKDDSSQKQLSLKTKLKLKSSWEAGPNTYYQYDVIITNTSRKNCNNWSVDIAFNQNLTFFSGWNAKFSSHGNVVHICSAVNTATIKGGESCTYIGFIVCASDGLKPK